MSVEEEIVKLEGLTVSSPHAISIEYLDHRGRKTTKLVGNASDENHIKSQHRTYEFEFKEPQFVSAIQFHSVDYADGIKANFTCTYYPSGADGKAQVLSSGNKWTVHINGFVTKFTVEPPRKFLGDQLLTSVQIQGLHSQEFAEVAKQVGAAESFKQAALEKCRERLSEVTSKEAEVAGLEQQIVEKSESLEKLEQRESELSAAVESEQEKLEVTERAVGSKKQELSEFSARIESASSSIEQKTGERQQLSTEITKAKAELRELKENINMFPTEISGFVSQGASNIRRYSFLAAIPIIIIGLVTVDLFSKASELSHLENLPANISVWEVLIARFPYVLVCGALIASSYKLARVFIGEIIRINEQRLNLTKISIIAKDVSDASEDGLAMDDAARYEHRTHLKMDLLRSHLKGYLAEEYRYSKKSVATPEQQSDRSTDEGEA
ncbi:hypothetical protein [Zhongshania sp.]|uniref:hypothetical protein n=1 Tax=Zhongshania sp. TaxID=1971902 RepID=UPI001B732A4C|nr:hypothetical protein [Zhongshania sp.]MBQ0794505.1 hypothetical protein [Zhongshania sp.]